MQKYSPQVRTKRMYAAAIHTKDQRDEGLWPLPTEPKPPLSWLRSRLQPLLCRVNRHHDQGIFEGREIEDIQFCRSRLTCTHCGREETTPWRIL